MAVTQYIGARYVPIFFDGGGGSTDWVANIPYDPMVIVTRLGSSYTSKKSVPNTVGAPEDNPEYWALTGNYNAQVEAYRQEVEGYHGEVEQYKDDVADMIAGLRALSTFEGDTDTERMQAAVDAGGALIDSDIVLTNLVIDKCDVTFWGNNHTIDLIGTISGNTTFTHTIKFIDCNFDGSNGGQIILDEANAYLYDVSFHRCRFVNFTENVIEGSCQEARFFDCYFNDNAKACMVFSQIDNLVIIGCEVENHSKDFLGCSGEAQNVVVRDSVIEGLTGTAFTFLRGVNIGVFSGLYLEDNDTNFKIVKNSSQGAKFENIYCIIGATANNKCLVRLEQDNFGTGYMIGNFIFENNTVYNGRIVHIDATNTVSSKLTFRSNHTNVAEVYNQTSSIPGSILGADIRQKQLTIALTAAANGSAYSITDDADLYGHQILGAVITYVVNTSTWAKADSQYWICRLDGTNNKLIFYGDGANELRYEVTVLYR